MYFGDGFVSHIDGRDIRTMEILDRLYEVIRIYGEDGKVAKEIFKSQFDEMGVEMTKSEGLTSLIKCEKFRTN